MSELRAHHPDAPDPTPDADRPRPEPTATEFQRLESLAESRVDERKSYTPSDHLTPSTHRDAPAAEHQPFERPSLGALGDRIKQAITDRFHSPFDAEKLTDPDDPREVHEIQRPSWTKDYYTDLPRATFDRCLVRDSDNPIPLFDGPPSRNDIRQGWVGDCGVLATLGAVAGHRPEAIRNAIAQTGDGTYEVTLHKITPATPTDPVARPTAETVTYRLNDELPVNLDEWGAPPAGAVPDKCAWPALMEKALAGQDQGWGPTRQVAWDVNWLSGARQVVDDTRTKGGLQPAPLDAPTGYDRLDIGSTSLIRADLLAELTGEEAEVRPIPDVQLGEQALLDEFRNQLDDDKPILVGTRTRQGSESTPFPGHVWGHAYEVTGVENDKVHLRNPWGEDKSPGPLEVTDFWEYFRNVNPDGSRSGNYATLS